LKNYVFAEIEAKDCEKTFIRGWGPGGQSVNKARNCVQLKHIPTNCVVKVHESRSLNENVKIAQERLKLAVDRHLNGDNCYQEQLHRLQGEHDAKVKRQRMKHRERKKEFAEAEKKENEQNTSNNE